jgi:hypothetical protein
MAQAELNPFSIAKDMIHKNRLMREILTPT